MALPSFAAWPETRPSWVGRMGLAGDWAKRFYCGQRYYALTPVTKSSTNAGDFAAKQWS